MNKAKKKKQVAAEPLQEPPETMLPCEPAVPQVETFEERVIRATRSMSPEKTRVVRLCMELGERNEWCANIRRLKRQYYREAKVLKRTMKSLRRAQNLVGSEGLHQKSNWLSRRQTKSGWLLAEKSTTHVVQNG